MKEQFYKPSKIFYSATKSYEMHKTKAAVRCACFSLPAYLHTGTCRQAWWAAACPPCRGGQHSGRYQAPYSRSSPTLTATADGSRSTAGWLQLLWRNKQMKSQLTDGDSETENRFWRKDGRIEACTLKARKEKVRRERNYKSWIEW